MRLCGGGALQSAVGAAAESRGWLLACDTSLVTKRAAGGSLSKSGPVFFPSTQCNLLIPTYYELYGNP